jgi:penicillin-insensitive murein endopeptidase
MKFIYLIIVFLLCATFTLAADNPESICYGTTEKGRIESSWQLPSSGQNFTAYSLVGAAAGRNYVHSKVYETILNAYKNLHLKAPDKVFVYGEAGWKKGGRFRPHKTHQNGLSADFFVPVLDENRKSISLPTNALNKFGYSIEFDSKGKYKEYSVDFEAMAAHLVELRNAADKNGIKIWRVIFDTDLQKLLFQTSTGKDLQQLMAFSTKKPWVRHDEHYHVDFIVPCKEFR